MFRHEVHELLKTAAIQWQSLWLTLSFIIPSRDALIYLITCAMMVLMIIFDELQDMQEVVGSNSIDIARVETSEASHTHYETKKSIRRHLTHMEFLGFNDQMCIAMRPQEHVF